MQNPRTRPSTQHEFAPGHSQSNVNSSYINTRLLRNAPRPYGRPPDSQTFDQATAWPQPSADPQEHLASPRANWLSTRNCRNLRSVSGPHSVDHHQFRDRFNQTPSPVRPSKKYDAAQSRKGSEDVQVSSSIVKRAAFSQPYLNVPVRDRYKENIGNNEQILAPMFFPLKYKDGSRHEIPPSRNDHRDQSRLPIPKLSFEEPDEIETQTPQEEDTPIPKRGMLSSVLGRQPIVKGKAISHPHLRMSSSVAQQDRLLTSEKRDKPRLSLGAIRKFSWGKGANKNPSESEESVGHRNSLDYVKKDSTVLERVKRFEELGASNLNKGDQPIAVCSRYPPEGKEPSQTLKKPHNWYSTSASSLRNYLHGKTKKDASTALPVSVNFRSEERSIGFHPTKQDFNTVQAPSHTSYHVSKANETISVNKGRSDIKAKQPDSSLTMALPSAADKRTANFGGHFEKCMQSAQNVPEDAQNSATCLWKPTAKSLSQPSR